MVADEMLQALTVTGDYFEKSIVDLTLNVACKFYGTDR